MVIENIFFSFFTCVRNNKMKIKTKQYKKNKIENNRPRECKSDWDLWGSKWYTTLPIILFLYFLLKINLKNKKSKENEVDQWEVTTQYFELEINRKVCTLPPFSSISPATAIHHGRWRNFPETRIITIISFAFAR